MHRRFAFLGVSLLAGVAMNQAGAQGIFSTSDRDSSGQACEHVPIRGDLVVLGMYGGKGAPLPYALDGDQHGGHAVKVSGSGSGRITLVLSSYESTIWDLSAIRDRVSGVMAYGYYPQGVSGLPSSVPVMFRSQVPRTEGTSGQDPCLVSYDGFEGMYKTQQQADQIRSVLGSQPRRWYGGYSPTSFNVDGGEAIAPTTPPASTVRAGVEVKQSGLMPGNDGLEQLVRAGALRRFDKRDVDDWVTRGGRLQIVGGPMAHISGFDPMDHVGEGESGYLVLRSLSQVPAGLAGADSVIFVVPNGLTMPGDAGHSTIYSLTGYPGRIPPPSGRPVPIDMRAQMIARSSQQYSAASMFVEWDPNGKVTRTGALSTPMTTRPIIIQEQQIPTIAPPTSPQITPVSIQEPDQSRDMTPSALLSALLIALGVGGLLYERGIIFLPNPGANDNDHGKLETAPATITPPRDDAPPQSDIRVRHPPREESVGTPPEIHSIPEFSELVALLQEAMDASRDDATILSLLRFKRTILKALEHPDYDADLAVELDAIVERHIREYVTTYLRAARQTPSEGLTRLEDGLRQGVTRLTGRVEEITAQQIKRYTDAFAENGEFLRTRHPGPDELGSAS